MKNKDPHKQYKMVKNKFSIKIMVFLFFITLMPVMKIVTETKIEIRPIDWKKKSEITLPLYPSIFLISFSPVYIKFGSSGEWLIKDIKEANLM